jgi:hypothetical protein
MKTLAISPAFATACLVSLTAVAYAETEPLEYELQKGPDDFVLSGELLNKDYDQGVIRNDNVTAHAGITARYFDIGLHIDDYMAVGSDPNLPRPVKSGETTQFSAGLDYLIEWTNLFQILPHYEWETYPNLPKQPYKDQEEWIGADGWYELPWQGLEAGFGLDYNPFYNGELDKFRGGGGLSGHAFRSSIGAREFFQHAPLDLAFWETINYGNGEYKNFLIGDNATGFTTFDIGVKYTAPFYINEFWTVFRLEVHYWLEQKDRNILSAAGKDTTEVIIGFGFEWRPEN